MVDPSQVFTGEVSIVRPTGRHKGGHPATGVRGWIFCQEEWNGTQAGRQAGDGDRGTGRCADRAFGRRGGISWPDGGQVRYRCDKAGIVHCSIGKASFKPEALKENLLALIADLQKHKPSTSKGVYLQRVSVSSTMGPGIAVDRSSLGV